jgi:hypothetical protein
MEADKAGDVRDYLLDIQEDDKTERTSYDVRSVISTNLKESSSK